jgi:3-hydroxyacyl-[acyl-carrier-protein] dehydratase
MRWIWIDRFTEFRRGEFARAVKQLSLAEDIFDEHFPDYPVMPAALLLEGLAQTGGILVGEANDFKEKVVLAKITKAKFTREALAGEVVTYEATVLYVRPEGASIAGRILIEGEPIGEAEVTFAHLDQSRSQLVFGDRNFVFSGELKRMLDTIRTLGTNS